jgi:hypothetical protein
MGARLWASVIALKRLRDVAIYLGERAPVSSWCKGKPFSTALRFVATVGGAPVRSEPSR